MNYPSQNVLILTNMRGTAATPYIGKFVRDQRDAIKAIFKGNIEYFEMPEVPVKQLKYLRFFYDFLLFVRKRNFTIIHVHFYFPTIIAAFLYKRFINKNCKIFVTFHGSDVFLYSKRNKVYYYLLQFVDSFIFVSKGLHKGFVNKFGTIKKPVHILCAGINPQFFQDNVSFSQKKLYDLVFIGTINENKGADRMHHILMTYPRQLRVIIVGRGPKEALFNTDFPSKHRITLSGSLHIEEVINALQQSKYLINLSHNESFGMVLSEAMALGTPVIATKTDGSLEQVTHEKNGFLLPQNKVAFETTGLNIIKQALEIDDTHYSQMVENAQFNSQQFSMHNVSHKIAAMYESEIIYQKKIEQQT
jgi:glycosyltransferase involved in cell wall biosynthesis